MIKERQDGIKLLRKSFPVILRGMLHGRKFSYTFNWKWDGSYSHFVLITTITVSNAGNAESGDVASLQSSCLSYLQRAVNEKIKTIDSISNCTCIINLKLHITNG